MEPAADDLVFALPAAMRQEIIDHAHQESPRECCGLISGVKEHARRLYRLTNLAVGNSLYEIDPREIYELEFREMPNHGTEVLAIYHSHPASPAYPSATDLALAFWPEAYYLICSLVDPVAPEIRGFRLAEGRVREATILFEEYCG